MSVRERILTIRLLEKAARYPGYVQTLGLEYIAPDARAAGAIQEQMQQMRGART